MALQQVNSSVTTGTRYNTRATRLCDELLSDIHTGRYPRGGYLPAESSLAATYQVSRATIRKAVDILVQNHKLEKAPRRGVKVPGEGSSVQTASAAVQTPGRSMSASGQGESRVVPAMRVKTTFVVAWSGTVDHAPTQICEGFRQYGEQHGVDVRICVSSESHTPTLEMLSHIENLANGVFIYPFDEPEYVKEVNRLLRIGFPVVATRELAGSNVSIVNSNEPVGVYQAVNYLIEKYHRPACCLSTTGTVSSDIRHTAYSQAMRDAGFGDQIAGRSFQLDANESDPTIWGVDKSPLIGVSAAKRMLKTVELPCSVYCSNDYVAASVYKAAEECGLVVGRDVMVIGTDDAPLAKFLRPTLTTLHAHRLDIGYEAAKLLHKMVAGQVTKPVHIALPYKFMIRESA